jgi:hypothetical protein
MNSNEIKETIKDICDKSTEIPFRQRQNLYALYEIAYQLAIMNEKIDKVNDMEQQINGQTQRH